MTAAPVQFDRIPADKIRRAGDPPSPKPRQPCGGCGARRVVRWLGVRWYGTPWPLRWHLEDYRPRYMPSPGCGCIVKLKNLGLAMGRIRGAVSWWWRS